MRFKGFYIGRAQRVAAALLLCLLAECLWVVARQPLSPQDYRFARCGREMWEKPSPLAGYFTTCGNLQGRRHVRLPPRRPAVDARTLDAARRRPLPQARKPPLRQGLLNGSTWEARHELVNVKYLLRLPFVLFAFWLGGGLWWVARRLFGNEGGALALALYVFCPAIIRYACSPNNEILALWGLYGLVYTAIGVAHAMQGPRRKWRPRILLLTFALGMTACAHLLAALIGFVAGAIFLFYLADRRRSYASQILIFSALGAMLMRLRLVRLPHHGVPLRLHRRQRTLLVQPRKPPRLHRRSVAVSPRSTASLSRSKAPSFSRRSSRSASTSLRAAAATSATPSPLLMTLRCPALHHADANCALALGAAVPVHLHRRRFR